MADDYWIDLKRPHGYLGADDYVIQPRLAGGHHHHHHRRGPGGYPLFMTVDFGDAPVIVERDEYDTPDNVSGFFSDIGNAFASAGADIVHTVNSAAHLAGKGVKAVGKALKKPLKAAIKLNPITAIGGLVVNIAHGERLDKAFLHAGQSQIAAVRDIAPYVKMVASYVPGVGTGVAAAIAAGTALADGRSITDAVIDSAQSAIPGGIARNVFKAANSIAHGNSITEAAMQGALANLPPNVQQAARTAIAVAGGKNVRAAVLKAIHDNVPAEAKKALAIGTALTVARNIQSHVANAVMKPEILAALRAATPIPPALKKAEPRDAAGQRGYHSAIALLQHTGVTPTALAAVRMKTPIAERRGFDHGLRTYVAHEAPSQTSLVRGGVVTRGHWRPAKKGEKAVTGRLIQHGKVVHGQYVRV